ncbi:MAG TPA: hypothetical protein VGK41_01270 [Solirubrobacterales bacterium]
MERRLNNPGLEQPMAAPPGRVTDTPAYKRLLPCIRKEDRDRFTRAMQVMFERGEACFGAQFFGEKRTPHQTLLYAFRWRSLDGGESMEVHDFWADLYTRLARAAREA